MKIIEKYRVWAFVVLIPLALYGIYFSHADLQGDMVEVFAGDTNLLAVCASEPSGGGPPGYGTIFDAPVIPDPNE